MVRNRTWMLIVMVVVAGWGIVRATPPEEAYRANRGWCPSPLPAFSGPLISDQHGQWHMIGWGPTMGLEFVEFHREFLAQSDDYRLYDIFAPAGAPEDAIIPVLAQPGSLLKFTHTSLNAYARPASHDITAVDGRQQAWVPRPAVLRLRNPIFHGDTDNDVGMDLDSMFHGNGHGSIGSHDGAGPAAGPPGFPSGDMLSVANATRDGAFYQWHKNIDNIYSDWAVGQYQLVGNTGTPIYFSVNGAATGAAGSSLNRRGLAGVYQGNNPPLANQYGASPRIASDTYVGDINNSNLLYGYGVRQWEVQVCVGGTNNGNPCRVNADCPGGGTCPLKLNAWDVDAWTILNPPGTQWYFSVTMGSTGAAGSAVVAQAVKGGDVFESTAVSNILYRTEAQLGLAAAASDNLDALEVDQQKRVQATNDYARPGIADRSKQWFSLRRGTDFGVEAGAVVVGPNDILRFNAIGTLVIDVTAATLGLNNGVGGDELDALVITDEDASNSLSGGDRIYYSLAAGSPALGVNSPADVLCRVFPLGGPCPAGLVTRTAASLGLLATDDLDALDVRVTPTNAGACCHGDGTCTEVLVAACNALGDTFWGPGTVCSAAECPSSPGACCQRNGTCAQLSNTACLSAGGTFRGAGTACTSVCFGGPNPGMPCTSNAQCLGGICAVCPQAPPNDECYGAYQIPYDYPSQYQPGTDYYEPPPVYTDNSYAYTTDPYYPPPPPPGYTGPPYYDPPYSCRDHETFFPPYGSGTVWYSYDVPPQPPAGPGPYPRPIRLYTDATYDYYTDPGDPFYGSYAGDTTIAVYYAPNYGPPPTGDPYGCYGLEEVACGDNHYEEYPPTNQGYGQYGYADYYPTQPGRYYIQLSTVGDANRGRIKLRVTAPPPPPDPHRSANGTSVTFGTDDVPTIPANFFDPGSLPFDGIVNLQPGPEDTLIQRSASMVCPLPPPAPCDPIEVELVALNLVSVAPIIVTGPGGPTQWDVAVGLSMHHEDELPGQLNAFKQHPNGGTFDAHIRVLPSLKFTRVDNPSIVRTLDYGMPPRPAIQINFNSVPWVINLGEHLVGTIAAPSDGNFVPGVFEQMPGNPNSQVVVTANGLSKGGGVNHPVDPVPLCPLPHGAADPCAPFQLRDCRATGAPDEQCLPVAWDIGPDGYSRVIKCDCIRVPPDPHRSRQGTSVNFGATDVPQIPGGFFYLGSPPFSGAVNLQAGPLDTLIQRSDAMVCPNPPFSSCLPIDVEIVALDLVSVSPITVGPTQWDVHVGLSVQPQPEPPGPMQAFKTHPNGGVFSSEIKVLPKITFTEVGNPGNVRTIDYGVEGRPPIRVNFNNVPWVINLGAGLYGTIAAPSNGNFVPGVLEQNPGDPDSQIEMQANGLSKGGGVNHPVGPVPLCPLAGPAPDPCAPFQARDCAQTTPADVCVPTVIRVVQGVPPEVLACGCRVTNDCRIVFDATGPSCINVCPDPGLLCTLLGTDSDGDDINDQFSCECVAPVNDIVWDPATNPTPWPNNNPLATTRSLRFTVVGNVGPAKLEAIKVTMVDLQHPRPANLPAQAPPNFTTYDTRPNAVCVGGALPGHHCDTAADCPGGGTCPSPVACTGDPTCTDANDCTLPSNSCTRWVGKPGTFLEFQDFPFGATYRASRLQCTPYYHDWKPEGLITVVGAEILPSSEYSVQVYGASCMGAESACTAVSPGVTMYTRRSGDTGPTFNPPVTSTQPDALDVAAVVSKAKQSFSPLVQKSITQLQPNLLELNADVSALDISVVVDAVRQIRYAYSGPCPCPSTVTCGATPCPAGDGVCVMTYGAGAKCVKTCAAGANAGDPCINNTHCPGSSCGTPLCRDRCGRCSP